MFLSIFISYPFYYILIAFVFSILSSGFLYFYNKKKPSLDSPFFIRCILFFLRFATLFLLLIVLLETKWKFLDKTIENPVIVFLQDSSQSIISTQDSLFYQLDYTQYLDSLNRQKDISIYGFGHSLNKDLLKYDHKSTNISSALRDLSEIYSNINVSAYILSSDGIFNEGTHPIFTDLNLNAPLYTIGTGDTTISKDISISSIKNNQITYLGNETPVELIFNAKEMAGENIFINVYNTTTDPLHTSPIHTMKKNVFDADCVIESNFSINTNNPGINKFTIEVISDTYEANLINNKKSFFIEVIDNRKKILILFANHHPDIAAIKSSLIIIDEYEIDISSFDELLTQDNLSDLDDKLSQYSLIICHQSSSIGFSDVLFKKISQVPTWYILGKNSNLLTFNSLQNTIDFQTPKTNFEFINVELNQSFNHFTISDSLYQFLSTSMSLLTPFSEYNINGIPEVLIYKKIGSMNTKKPIFLFKEDSNKSAFLIGEGLWRLRMADSFLNGNNLLYNTFILKVVQYLLLNEDKNRLRLDYNQIEYSNKRMVFNAELYNSSFEMVNSENLQLNIVDSTGADYYYSFIPIDGKYTLDVGLLDVGPYNFTAEVTMGSDLIIKKGQFRIANHSIESYNLIADHVLLSGLSLKHGGKHITLHPDQIKSNFSTINNLINDIRQSTSHQDVTILNSLLQSLINFHALLICILFFLCLEWFLRRIYINY